MVLEDEADTYTRAHSLTDTHMHNNNTRRQKVFRETALPAMDTGLY